MSLEESMQVLARAIDSLEKSNQLLAKEIQNLNSKFRSDKHEEPIKSEKKVKSVDVNKILSEKDAAIYIGMSRSYLRQDRMNGIRINRTPGPRFLKLGRSVRYLKEDLDNWLLEHRVNRFIP